jgi:hypothetical protein
MRKLAVVAFTFVGIGMLLLEAIVADSAGATLADVEGYAQTTAVNRGVTPVAIIAQEHAQFQR